MRVIKKEFGREELISRIPALFAYLEADDAGEFHLHKATDAPQGCWGKIIADIKVPDTATLIVDGVTLVEANKVYSYRTLINLYYKYRADYSDQGFIKFIDKYIGLVDNTVEQTKERDLMPSKVYLADVRNLYKIYGTYHVIYQKYYADYSDDKKQRELDHSICCAIKKYIRMGDDKMYNFLGTLFTEMNTCADDAYTLANNTLNNETWYRKGNSPLISEWEHEHMSDTDEYEEVENPFDADAHVSLMINLNQSQNDLGFLSCYLNPWVPGEKHYKGDLYTYEGNTYICTEKGETEGDYFDDRTGEIVFNPPQYDDEEVENGHFELLAKRYQDEVITSKNPNGGKKFKSVYVNTDNPKDIITEEAWNELSSDEKGKYDRGKYISKEDPNVIITAEEWDNLSPDNKEKYEQYYYVFSSEDSKLKGLRRYTKYINEVGEYEEVPEGEDWLYFYRKGLVMNYTYICDDDGELVDAYGDVITDIRFNQDEKTITFEYTIGVHLKIIENQNGTRSFIPFPNDKHGVKYTEVYNYEEGGELDELIKSEDPNLNFANYIDGAQSGNTRFNFKKYSFSLLNSMCITKVDTGKERLDWSYVGTDSEVKDDGVVDYMYADIMKYDYLTGITYKPEVNTSVYIDRGNYSAFERHIALSQINTMEDLETYRNGGFFNIQKVN